VCPRSTLFFSVLGLEFRAFTLNHFTTNPFFFVIGIFEIGSHELFACLALNLELPDLCLLSSKVYRGEPQHPAEAPSFYKTTSHIGFRPIIMTLL
jgi:hypothetical protein